MASCLRQRYRDSGACGHLRPTGCESFRSESEPSCLDVLAGFLQRNLTVHCDVVKSLATLEGVSEAARQISRVRKGDLLISICFPRYLADTVTLTKSAREAGVDVLAITDKPTSTIAKHADVCLYASSERQYLSNSETAALGMIEALSAAVAHRSEDSLNAAVFAFTYVLGINLMPRIRNWKDLVLYRPDRKAKYKHIDKLFTATIDWTLIEQHWQKRLRYNDLVASAVILQNAVDMMQALREMAANGEKVRAVPTHPAHDCTPGHYYDLFGRRRHRRA